MNPVSLRPSAVYLIEVWTREFRAVTTRTASMRESTRTMLGKHGWRIDRAAHNYIYFAWYYPYVKTMNAIVGIASHFTWLKPLKYLGFFVFNRYHGKVLSSSDARKILTLNEDVVIVADRNRRIIPFKYAHSIILQNPGYIAVMDCPCKKTLRAPEETINSCLAVGSGTGAFWVDRCGEKYHARRVSQREALGIVTKFRSMGYITQAFFKVATGGSTGVICSCHPDTCVSLRASRMTRRIEKNLSQNAPSGYSVRHDPSQCTRCGSCASVCHFGAIVFDKSERLYRRENCMGCGLCAEHCPNGALSLFIDPEKPLPLDLDLLKQELPAPPGGDSNEQGI